MDTLTFTPLIPYFTHEDYLQFFELTWISLWFSVLLPILIFNRQSRINYSFIIAIIVIYYLNFNTSPVLFIYLSGSTVDYEILKGKENICFHILNAWYHDWSISHMLEKWDYLLFPWWPGWCLMWTVRHLLCLKMRWWDWSLRVVVMVWTKTGRQMPWVRVDKLMFFTGCGRSWGLSVWVRENDSISRKISWGGWIRVGWVWFWGCWSLLIDQF